jgi:hypothetical protein
MAGLDQTLRDCYDCLTSFNTKIDKCSGTLGERGQKQMVKGIYRKIKWMNEKEEVGNFDRDISTYLALLNVLIQLAGFYSKLAYPTSITDGTLISRSRSICLAHKTKCY